MAIWYGKEVREYQSLKINPFVDEHINLAYHNLQARIPELEITVERDSASAVCNVALPRHQIARVLLNLISNAFDAVWDHT